MKGNWAADDLDSLYEVKKLREIVWVLEAMPLGQRRLQAAINAVERLSG
jgi:hypothetical protein